MKLSGGAEITQVNSNNSSSIKMLSFDVIFAAVIIVIYFSFVHSPFQVGLMSVICTIQYILKNFVCGCVDVV